MKTEVKKLENAQVEIIAVLPKETLEKQRTQVEKSLLDNAEADGFRKGNVPKDIAMKNISPMQVLEEMAQQAISSAYVDILQKEDIKAIGHPQITITKIAEEEDLEFKIITAVLPEITLGDYKEIAKLENVKEISIDVDEKEIKEAINNLRKMRVQQEMAKDQKEGEEPVSWSDIKEEDLPELNEEWVKTLGKFENIDDFKAKITENLKSEKEAKNSEKRRISIVEAILEKSEIEVPDMMVDYEVEKMMHEFEGNIATTGMAFDEYLKSINKTKEDYKKEWRDQGFQRAQTQLMLNDIAASEKIDVPDETIQSEVEKIMEQYKNQKGIDENNVRAYVATILTHQEVFKFLDKQ
jgi:FKBP-type peptidyl-prolyl cis-trans isomerase (trigger factor)